METVTKKNKKEDYPFLANEPSGNIVFGLSKRTYNILRVMAGFTFQQHFKSKEEILNVLKGKTRADLYKTRTVGKRTLEELIKWTEKCLK